MSWPFSFLRFLPNSSSFTELYRRHAVGGRRPFRQLQAERDRVHGAVEADEKERQRHVLEHAGRRAHRGLLARDRGLADGRHRPLLAEARAHALQEPELAAQAGHPDHQHGQDDAEGIEAALDLGGRLLDVDVEIRARAEAERRLRVGGRSRGLVFGVSRRPLLLAAHDVVQGGVARERHVHHVGTVHADQLLLDGDEREGGDRSEELRQGIHRSLALEQLDGLGGGVPAYSTRGASAC